MIVPIQLLQGFGGLAFNNRDCSGQQIESLCYFLGYLNDRGEKVVTEAVVPRQQGDGAKVDDLGIGGHDSIQWALTSSKTKERFGDSAKLLAWCHTHVRGCELSFSSVDVHSQFALEAVFGDVCGVVFQMDDALGVVGVGCFKLTQLGSEAVRACGRSGQSSTRQHGSCSHREYVQNAEEVFFHDGLQFSLTDRRFQLDNGN